MENNQEISNKKSRHAPASYPAASLSLCLRKASLAAESSAPVLSREWVTQDAFAMACGYKGFEGNSAPKGLIAALTHFYLIERDAQKRIRITQDLKDSLGSEKNKGDLIAKAIRRPKVHQALLSAFGTQASPTKYEISKHLIDKLNFAQRPAQIMASNFQEDLALLRSIEPITPANNAVVHPKGSTIETIVAPSGVELCISTTRPLSAQDWVFMERYMHLKAETALDMKK